ncbi:Cysteine alpha-hairpin motif superfamily [Pseudocohnilembus persalinus]|uniref:Cysteine alpha-hairpin motif superfamily n=1 Tax=Pseudocohnilembus persalinus TaxID=266149 RepID=A0A0V0QCP3_PSEPJ|nr:Cysteine alpha-hairpin motif superfamily [Pseudocohnilembus persalinus]|eukprot:KRW99990.1 Cysteine alpha-hairpin motif superfamily [Pseudocohnilembus persalinus]
MPRRSSGGFGGRSSQHSQSPPPRQTQTHQAPPQQQHHSQPQQSHQQAEKKPGMFSGFGQTMATGLAFGAGSAVAHQAVNGVVNSFTGSGSGQQQQQGVQQQQGAYGGEQQQANYAPQKCQAETNNFSKCLQENSQSIEFCQTYMDMLKECQNNY